MEKTFSITENTHLVLYGAATMGTLYFKKFRSWNLSVTAFIDKRSDELEDFMGLPVFPIDNDELDKKNIVVILAVKNVFEHSRIASKLQRASYEKIIFRPYSALNKSASDSETKLNDIYTLITESQDFNLKDYESIPVIDALLPEKLTEHGIIKKDEKSVTFYLPITMLFCDKKGYELKHQYPILCLKPHINFCSFLLGKQDGEFYTYLNYCIKAAENIGTVKITDSWKKNVISNRSEVFLDMLHKYNVEPDFFINKAVNVIWNDENKYFFHYEFLFKDGKFCNYGKIER